MNWLMLPLALLLVGIARIGILLFPDVKRDESSLDSLTKEEHDAIGAFYGYCQGDEQK